MTRVVVLLAVLLLTPSACTTESRRKIPERLRVPDGAVVLPTTRCGDWFLVDATIDGEGPFRMMVDTGAEVSALHVDVADGLEGRDLGAHRTVQGSGGGRTTIDRWVRIDTLRVGAFEAGGFDLAVLDLHALTHTLGTRLDGILGYATFAGSLLTLDYDAGEVRVEVATLPPPDGETVFGLRSRTRPMLPIELQGRIVSVLLDSGQRGAFSVAPFDELTFVEPPVQTGFSLGTDGRTPTRAGRLDGDVRLGRFTFERPIVRDSGKGNRIGAGVLKRFLVTFDPFHERVRLTRRGDDVVTTPPARGLACGFAPREDGWEVVELYEGSPLLAAGVAPGDVLTGLDGQPFDELGCGRWGALGDAETIALTVRRGDDERAVNVPVPTTIR